MAASGNRQRYTADVNEQIPTGNNGDFLKGTALRLNLMYQDGGVPGRDIVEKNSFGIAPSLAFGLGTDTRVTFAFQHVVEDNIPDYGLPAYLGRPLPGIPRDEFYGHASDHEDLRQDSYTARIEHDFSEHLTLRNQTSFIQNSSEVFGVAPNYTTVFRPGTATAAPVPAGDIYFSRQNNTWRDYDTFSNQTSLTAKFETGPFKHTLVGGFDYIYETADIHSYKVAAVDKLLPITPGTPNNPYQPPIQPVPAVNPPLVGYPVYDPLILQHGATRTLGLYAFDTIEFGKHWILSGGLREDSYDAEFHSRNTAGVITGPFNGSDDLLSGKIGLTYKPVEEGSIYLAYSSTQTPPGTAAVAEGAGVTGPTGSTATGNNNFNSKPQQSENIELGTKWDFFHSNLTVSGAVFHTVNKNVIYANDPTDPTSFAQDGAQKINGVSVGATGKITDNWNILASATYLDATLDQAGATGPALSGITGATIPIDGNQLARTPKFSGTLWSTYKLPKGFTVGLGLRYQGKTYTATTNTISIAPYAVVDGLIQYDINDHVNLRFNVYNLLDREYVATSGGGGGNTIGGTLLTGGHATYGQPISCAFSTNFSF